jgi:hypothetical protein
MGTCTIEATGYQEPQTSSIGSEVSLIYSNYLYDPYRTFSPSWAVKVTSQSTIEMTLFGFPEGHPSRIEHPWRMEHIPAAGSPPIMHRPSTITFTNCLVSLSADPQHLKEPLGDCTVTYMTFGRHSPFKHLES